MELELPSPFCEINIKAKKTVKRSLEASVIKKYPGWNWKTKVRCLLRDIFMFSFYTRGMAFVDIALLKK